MSCMSNAAEAWQTSLDLLQRMKTFEAEGPLADISCAWGFHQTTNTHQNVGSALGVLTLDVGFVVWPRYNFRAVWLIWGCSEFKGIPILSLCQWEQLLIWVNCQSLLSFCWIRSVCQSRTAMFRLRTAPDDGRHWYPFAMHLALFLGSPEGIPLKETYLIGQLMSATSSHDRLHFTNVWFAIEPPFFECWLNSLFGQNFVCTTHYASHIVHNCLFQYYTDTMTDFYTRFACVPIALRPSMMMKGIEIIWLL